MKIQSKDNKNYIEINSVKEHDWPSYDISIKIDIGHGEFSGQNIDVCLLNLGEFIQDFDGFISNRTIEPKLTGTYDTFLRFYAKGNSVLVSFSLGDAFCGYEKTIMFSLNGGFVVEAEYLLSYLASFKELAKAF